MGRQDLLYLHNEGDGGRERIEGVLVSIFRQSIIVNYDCNIIKMEPNKNIKQEPELKPYTMDEINQMIDESLDDIKNGRVYSLEEFNKKMEEDIPWLK